jgi:hypothetical protein
MRKKLGCYFGRHEWLEFRRPDGQRFSACRFCLKEKPDTPSPEANRSGSNRAGR